MSKAESNPTYEGKVTIKNIESNKNADGSKHKIVTEKSIEFKYSPGNQVGGTIENESNARKAISNNK